jgi:hypothetical protein
MTSFFTDRGSAYAWWIAPGAPQVTEQRIMRADPPSGPWREVYRTDAHIPIQRPAAGRAAFVAIRSPFQGGGASTQEVVLLDLTTGASTAIDRWALSAATFRGGGGGPRRPVAHVALGATTIAWTRLIERVGGAVEGELRYAALSDPSRATVVASSDDWIRPIGIDDRALVYVLGRPTGDELHVRELVTGADRVLTTTAPPATNGYYPLDDVAVSGRWVAWIDRGRAASAATATIRAVDVVSGEARSLDGGGPQCAPLTGGSKYLTWMCGPSNAPAVPRVLDVARWVLVDLFPAGANGVAADASGDGLLWTERTAAGRRVHIAP